MTDFFSLLSNKEFITKDQNLTAIQKAKDLLKETIEQGCYNIHIIGTNGKGSTGRYIADALITLGYNVGHYTSPHINSVNERFYLNGANATDEMLNSAHNKVVSLIGDEVVELLSYFEYITAVAMYLFKDCDYAVIEAGLGGEYDATTVFKKDISVLTSVSYDHCEVLGSSIKEIATTKLKSVRNRVIVAKQEYNGDVLKVLKELNLEYIYASSIVKDRSAIDALDIATFLKDNLVTAYALLKYLQIKNLDITLFNKKLTLDGRFEYLRYNIVVDVGHNPSSANAILQNLSCSVVLVYNCLANKDYKSILKILKPKIKSIYILDIDTTRGVNREELLAYVSSIGLKILDKLEIRSEENYLVYGSFYLVNEFKKIYNI